MVHFVVMDHDFLRSNDFAGEAFLDLAEVPGFGQPGMSNTLRQFNLILIHPSRRRKFFNYCENSDRDMVKMHNSEAISISL